MKKLVFPDYNHSLLNLTNSILKFYNVEPNYKSLCCLDEVLKGNYKNVVFYLVDAMGSKILEKHVNESLFLLNNRIDNLTTVFPSTTVAATTTAITGQPPVATAWLGWQQYVKEENKNVIFFLNKDYYNEDYKFDYNVAEKYVGITNIYEKINASNKLIKTHDIFPEFRNPELKTILDQVKSVIKTIDNNHSNFVYAYWDKLDTLMHEYGTSHELVKNHIKEIDLAFKHLNENMPEDTIVIVTADHGQVDVIGINLWEYKDLTSMFLNQPSIEARATAFYVNNSDYDRFERTFNNYFKDKFILYRSKDLIESGLFGKGQINPRTEGFLGDFFAIAIDNYSFKLQNAKHEHKATHAGLLEDEMIIPLIIIKKASSK